MTTPSQAGPPWSRGPWEGLGRTRQPQKDPHVVLGELPAVLTGPPKSARYPGVVAVGFRKTGACVQVAGDSSASRKASRVWEVRYRRPQREAEEMT